MTHWGWYWKVKRKHEPKSLCDFAMSIDSFHFFKRPGFSGFTINQGKADAIEAIFNGDKLSVVASQGSYDISIEKQPCHFGGFRYFFQCPNSACKRRMRKLYKWGYLFLCRKCLSLGYYSQRLIPSRRFSRMQRKIEDQLAQLGGNIFQKPKWMRHRTFEALKAKERHYYCEAEMALGDECYKFYGFYP